MRAILLPVLGLFVSILASAQTTPAPWTDKIKLGGDMRFRHDYNNKGQATDTAERHRARFRLRLGVQAELNEDIKARVRLAGGEAGDPISTNQTMTANASKKDIAIDLAMVEWKLNDESRLLLGKMESPVRPLPVSQLIYDTDYTPEGAAVANKWGPIQLNVGAFSIVERRPSGGTSEPDSWLLAGVASYKKDFNDGMGLLLALGYHNFTAIKKNAGVTAAAAFDGNSNVGGRYLHDYQVGEFATELSWKLPRGTFAVWADVANNFYIDENNLGILSGLTYVIHRDDAKPKWTITYGYMDIGRDTTLSALNNSDWGNGTDGGSGHMGQVSYLVNTSTQLTLTWFQMNVGGTAATYENQRGLLDLAFAF